MGCVYSSNSATVSKVSPAAGTNTVQKPTDTTLQESSSTKTNLNSSANNNAENSTSGNVIQNEAVHVAVKLDDDPTEKAKIKERTSIRRRRGSVSAEVDNATDPAYVPVIHPKDDTTFARIEQCISDCFLFASLDKAQRHTVITAMQERKASAGEVIINQGDAGDNFYVVDSGIYAVTLAGVNDGKPVLRYDTGKSFGELALMYNCPRAATVMCENEGVLWVLDRLTFKHVVINSMSGKRNKYELFLQKVKILEVRALNGNCDSVPLNIINV